MKSTLMAVLLLACVPSLAAMVRMQHDTFAERAARGVVRARSLPSGPPPGSSDRSVSRVSKTEPPTQETRT